jgi:hypothetical protein
MNRTLRAIALSSTALLVPTLALAQAAPANLPYHTVFGRLGAVPGDTGPGQAIPFTTLRNQILPFALPLYADDYGCKGDGVTNDTTCIKNVIRAANGTREVMFSGKDYCTDPLKIGDGDLPVPPRIGGVAGYVTTLLACGVSASPTVTYSNFSFDTASSVHDLRIRANGLHANGLLIHGCQFCSFERVRVQGATSYGVVVHGEPGYNVQYNSFRDIVSRGNNSGGGFKFYSTNNAGDYYVAANHCSGLRSQSNLGDGVNIDYATVDCNGAELEGNTGYGINANHTKAGVWNPAHIEGNTAGGINVTANTTNLHFQGGRIDAIGALLLSCPSCSIDQTDGAGQNNGFLRPTSIAVGQSNTDPGSTSGGINASLYYLAGHLLNFSDLAGSVPNSQLATMVASTTKCNATAGVAVPTDCSVTTMRTLLGVTSSGSDTTYAYRANNLSDLASASTARTNLGVAIGSNVQAWDSDLDCIAAISATGIIKRTGAGTCSAGAAAASDLTNGTSGSGAVALVNGATFIAPILGTIASGDGSNLTTLNGSNIATGIVAAARGGAGGVTGALRGNGSGLVTQAACADLSNGTASCSTDTTSATNISSGTLPSERLTGSYTGITGLGMLTAGGTGAGFTIALTTSTVTGTLPAGRLPNPSASTLGGVQSLASAANKWINTISTSGVPSATQPAFTDISGSVAASQMPALTGDCTTSAGAVATTCTKINGVDQTAAWTSSFTSVCTAQTPGGTPPTLTTNFSRYRQIGKTIIFSIGVTVTAAGTGAGSILCTLPFTAAAFQYAGSSFESAATGKSGGVFISSGAASMSFRDASATTYITTANAVVATITYEIP